ncbi:hypothetical protein L842_0822 [Mycobacterium intracellulare MIN_052511_1280]|nr:hypothetical protein L842_0822 [Mycobacterium intracellulare MIN_052511_1280]
MHDLDAIDEERRLSKALRWSVREHGGEPTSVNGLLDERLSWSRGAQ